jgi:signal transduction histidine kinase
MSHEGMTPATRGRVPDELSRGALQLVAEGVIEIVGFQLATISVVRQAPDGTQELEVVADAGDDATGEVILGRRTPLASLLDEIESAEVWGQFRFLPHEQLTEKDVENAYGWIVPDIEPIDAPDAWHPLDLLVALLHDDQGALRGTLAIDLPHDGRRPGPEQRRLLERFAVQAERTVVTTLEREELSEQVRLAETARRIVRGASAQHDLSRVLGECQAGLVEGFRSQGSWIQTFDEDGRGTGAVYASNGEEVELPAALVDLAEKSARRCWADQVAVVVAGDRPVPEVLTAQEQGTIVDFLDTIGVSSLLFVPLGAAKECLGNLVLTRTGTSSWTELDQQAALDIGHDLGRVILNARTFQREHELVVELQALDTYKSQLIATVSHELKNPLTSIRGYLEVLEAAEGLGPTERRAIGAMGRGADRLSRVVDDLLLMSKVGDPDRALTSTAVDLGEVVNEVLDLVSVTVSAKDLQVSTDLPDAGLRVRGDETELDRLVANLVSNAVKYTPEKGRINVGVEQVGNHVVLEVDDEGLGISEADQERLFEEFFRSTNPEATRLPGTGLGLAIVKRIVERHHGEISVRSALGEGSRFTVRLPVAG